MLKTSEILFRGGVGDENRQRHRRQQTVAAVTAVAAMDQLTHAFRVLRFSFYRAAISHTINHRIAKSLAPTRLHAPCPHISTRPFHTGGNYCRLTAAAAAAADKLMISRESQKSHSA